MMANPIPIGSVKTNQIESTHFGDILSAITAYQNMNQYKLSVNTKISQAMLSRIGTGKRNLTTDIAQRIASEIGCNPDILLEAFEETKNGSSKPVRFFVDKIFPNQKKNKDLGVIPRRLLKKEILEIFSNENEDGFVFRESAEPCEITDFDPTKVQQTSYDTVVGGYDDLMSGEPNQIEEKLSIPAHASIQVRTKETFTFPSWLEGDLHPASNLAKKGIVVAHGPLIDPLYSDYLTVTVINYSEKSVDISADEPFLTIRFWVL